MGPRGHRRPGSITRRALIAFGLLAFAVSACVPAASDPTLPNVGWPEPPASAIAAKVSSVIDGDSLRVRADAEELEIRLAEINAPEFDECYATAAVQVLDELEGAEVQIDVISTDQYGRTVAHLWWEGAFINGALVEQGAALAMTNVGRWSRELITGERAAREAEIGMWNPQACGDRLPVDLRLAFTAPDPPGPDNETLDTEIVTIHNDGDADVDLHGFQLRDESTVNRLRFPPGTTVPAGGALDVSTGCSPTAGVAWCSDVAIWNNRGDSALLLSPTGNVVAHARYDPPE